MQNSKQILSLGWPASVFPSPRQGSQGLWATEAGNAMGTF